MDPKLINQRHLQGVWRLGCCNCDKHIAIKLVKTFLGRDIFLCSTAFSGLLQC